MSDTDLARSWRGLMGAGGGGAARGGEALRPEAKEKDGREPVTVLSARDLSWSDQLKPWSDRAAEGVHKSEPVLDWFAVLAWVLVLPHV